MTHSCLRAAHLLRATIFLSCLLLLSSHANWAQALSGSYYVGTSVTPDASRTYATLPLAINSLNTNGVAANSSVTLVLLDASYALGTTTLIINALALSANQGISLVPSAGVNPVISGSNSTALLVLDGTDYLTINGSDGSSSTRTITLRNTAAAPAVLLRNDATNNALRYLTLESANTTTSAATTGTLLFGTASTGTTGNSNNTVANCELRDLSVAPNTVPAYAIYSAGTEAAPNAGNTVQNCLLHEYTAGGIYQDNTGNGNNWLVDGNAIYQSASRTNAGGFRAIRVATGSGLVVSNNTIYQASGTLTGTFYGVAAANGANVAITGNTIGGSNVGATGNALALAGTGAVYGIYLSVSATAPSSVQGNVVRNINSTSTGILYSINLQNGAAGIGTTTANTVGGTGAGQGLRNAGPTYGLLIENAATGTVQNNTFAGLSSSSGLVAGVYLAGTGVSAVSGNTISTLSSAAGSGTVSGVYNSNSGASPVSNNMITNLSATGGATVVGVNLTGSASTTISGNTVSNLSSSLTTAALLAGINAGTGAVVISGNTISNLSQSGLTSNLYGIMSNFVAGSNVTNNTLRNLTYSGSSTGQVLYGIYAGGSNTVSGNQVMNASITVSGNNNLRGIYVGGPAGSAPTVTGNTASGVLTSATGAANTAGLYVGSATASAVLGTVTVSTNSISNVGSTATAANTAGQTITGLQLGATNSGAAGTSVVERNRVWNVYGSTASTGTSVDLVQGLLVQGTFAGTFSNNQISLPAGTASQQTAGLMDATTGNTNNYYYNSVYLAPVSGGGATSYGFWRSAATSPSAVSLLNNLLFNGRAAASGAAYAIGTSSTANWPATASNYNLFIAPVALVMGNWGGSAKDFAGWKAAQPGGSGGDASSLSETSATMAAANLFASTAAGNLDLSPANAEAWYANGNGVQVAGQTADYSSTAARSTTVAGGSTDIGADELTPTAAPPALTASVAPSLGGTQTFALGGRPLASFTYGSAGTVPTSVEVRYYSGTNPPAPYAAGARYANAYFTFADANGDGSGFTYQPTLFYDLALLGTIASETAQRLAPRVAGNSGYSTAPTTVSTTARTLAGPANFTQLGLLAIADQAAPLPVTLVTFAAVRTGADAQLSWSTASEKNCWGYEVQVSADGLSFRALGFVNSPSANSQMAQYYQFTDREAGKQVRRYYRLRQIDLDGRFSYSPVQAVAFDGEALLKPLTAAPNPFADKLTLTVTVATAETAQLTVTDATGRPVLAQPLPVTAGTSQHSLPELAALPAGLYLLRVATADGRVQRVRAVKQ